MSCATCRADVAAELSVDNRRMLCARCQTELGIAANALPRVAIAPRTVETERDARELLARWSAQTLLEPATSPFAAKEVVQPEPIVKRSELRFDQPQNSIPVPIAPFFGSANQTPVSSVAMTSPTSGPQTTEPEKISQQKRSRKRVRNQRFDSDGPRTVPIHENPIGPSHHRPQALAEHEPVRHTIPRPGWTMLAGQVCAYGGVALLTCGTVLVMWSYFGGPASYLPSGFLAAAVGQMLLFLGVITLISGGMDQTVAEVTWRIDHLAAEIHDMHDALEKLESSRHKHQQNTSESHENVIRREAA